MAKIHGQLIRAAVETLGSDPATVANKFTGRLWYNTATNLMKYTDSSNAIHVFVDADTVQTLTNKTLSDSTTYFADNSDPTKLFQFQASGITAGNTRTYTVPNYDGTLATLDGSEVFTNKTISGASNTFSNIPVNTLAALTASRATVTDVSGFISAATTTATEIGYINGLTSAVQTQLDARVFKSTLTAKGSIYVATASATIAEQAVGANTYVLTANSGVANGIEWAAPASAPVSALEFTNVGLLCSVAASALTIALKQADGSTDPSSGSAAVKLGMRSSTATSGAFNTRSVTGALSMTVSSGSTLGHLSSVNRYIYVYVIDNAGTLELAVSSTLYSAGSVISTIAEGGAGAADLNATIYSTTARSNVPIRCIARLKSNQATAGTWASAPTEVSVGDNWNFLEKTEIRLHTHNGYGSTATKIPRFTTAVVNTGSAITAVTNDATNGSSFTVNEFGIYSITFSIRSATDGEDYIGVSLNASSTATGLTSLAAGERLGGSGGVPVSGNSKFNSFSWTGMLNVNDVIRPHTTTASTPGSSALCHFEMIKLTGTMIV